MCDHWCILNTTNELMNKVNVTFSQCMNVWTISLTIEYKNSDVIHALKFKQNRSFLRHKSLSAKTPVA